MCKIFSRSHTVIAADLNEWIRFDQPGEYRVTVRSRRVRMPGMATPVALVSNELALTITAASPEWQKQTFDQAVVGLEESGDAFHSGKSAAISGNGSGSTGDGASRARAGLPAGTGWISR